MWQIEKRGHWHLCEEQLITDKSQDCVVELGEHGAVYSLCFLGIGKRKSTSGTVSHF